MHFKEVMDKTGVFIAGVVIGVNEFVSQKGRSYWSVDLSVKGCKMSVNVRLPTGYPINTLVEYELAKLAVIVRPNFEKTGIELEAVAK